MNRTFNNGIGMVVVVDAAQADATAARRCAPPARRSTASAASPNARRGRRGRRFGKVGPQTGPGGRH
jgi:hypothetical protein